MSTRNHFDLLLRLALPAFILFCEEPEADDDDAEAEEGVRKVNKPKYLDFALRESKGETVNRSVLLDAKYDEAGKLISGKLMSIPADLNPEIHRLPGRKFWNDETDLLKLKIRAIDAEIADANSRRTEIMDTITELEQIGDPAQRAIVAQGRRALASTIRLLQAGGVSRESVLQTLQKALSK